MLLKWKNLVFQSPLESQRLLDFWYHNLSSCSKIASNSSFSYTSNSSKELDEDFYRALLMPQMHTTNFFFLLRIWPNTSVLQCFIAFTKQLMLSTTPFEEDQLFLSKSPKLRCCCQAARKWKTRLYLDVPYSLRLNLVYNPSLTFRNVGPKNSVTVIIFSH